MAFKFNKLLRANWLNAHFLFLFVSLYRKARHKCDKSHRVEEPVANNLARARDDRT